MVGIQTGSRCPQWALVLLIDDDDDDGGGDGGGGGGGGGGGSGGGVGLYLLLIFGWQRDIRIEEQRYTLNFMYAGVCGRVYISSFL